jgi:hypothetical protein
MKIIVERFDSGSNDTLGRVFVDGKLICFSIEDEKRLVKVKGDTRIPEGTYQVCFYDSPSHGKKSLMIKDVPKFDKILIHTGNTEDDTMGCLIVGKRIGTLNNKRAVLDSKQAFKQLYALVAPALDNLEDVEITYMEASPIL